MFIKSVVRDLQNHNKFKLLLALVLLILVLQIFILRGVPVVGLTFDDWVILFNFKLLGPSPYSQIMNVWRAYGVYTPHQIYYLGTLDLIFGQNYNAFWIVNILFKILATLSVYPLVLIVFKRKLLAFITTILFAINASSFGALEYPLKGIDYIAIISLNIFLISYYYLIKNEVWNLRQKFPLIILIKLGLYSGLTFLLIIIVANSPIQSFIILAFIPLIEALIYLKKPSLLKVVFMIIRLTLVYTPFLLFYKLNSGAVDIYLLRTRFLLYQIRQEGLLLLLSPLLLSVYYSVISFNLKGRKILSIYNLQKVFINIIPVCLLLFLTLMLSPIRTYPLLILILPIEMYIFLTKKTLTSLMQSVIRLFFFYLPFVILVFVTPYAFLSIVSNKSPGLISYIIQGNWHLLLTPLAGLGLLPLPNNLTSLFLGSTTIDQSEFYIRYILILSGIFSLFSFPLSFLLSKKPLKFFIKLTLINFTSNILLFLIITRHLNIQYNLQFNFNQTHIPYSLLGIYLTNMTLIYLSEYIHIKNKNLTLSSIWIGPFGALLFLVLTWLFSGVNSTYTSSVHWYLVIPSMFISFFTAGLLTKVHDLGINTKLKRYLSSSLVIYIFFFAIINREQVYNHFMFNDQLGRSAKDKIFMQDQILDFYKNRSGAFPALFYFDTSQDHANEGYYAETVLAPFFYWMHILRNEGHYPSGCVAILINSSSKPINLDKYIHTNDNYIQVKVPSTCINEGILSMGQPQLIDLSDIYAFKIKNKRVTNIKDEFLLEIEKIPPGSTPKLR